MGLEINYWDCKFADYDESWDGEEETRYYNCSHKDGYSFDQIYSFGTGYTMLNKYKPIKFCPILW